MQARHDIEPKDLIPAVEVFLDQRPGGWQSCHELWAQLLAAEPALAQQVQDKIGRYNPPHPNGGPWFISNTLWWIGQRDGYEVAHVEDVPGAKGRKEALRARAVQVKV